ncbi:MAG: methylenetetrahydrofolate--tRNA-(uracil(54)-C(5))-methyltransferase (FADH(2)-oxidizing) TrmFO [Peptococcaceae bacterium]|jgi:methylenetetrahydrofolate--tRNA-(uracil-5-)-methyltransferase|nr:methylenetetrahydrofolate--tRNA-(uracil(54)-C(5))-methyltransferase (FADH(2)-oxidizing) TrmFO [Peptococcaceae bacterium]
MPKVSIIGAGLAGAEAAWQLAQRSVAVELYEMRPDKMTPAHHSEYFAELVCSNSLRAAGLENAVGLLKEEMRRLNSLVIQTADETAVPAGGALAVDRERFSGQMTQRLRAHPLIRVWRQEVRQVPPAGRGIVIIASGPLTSDSLAASVEQLTGETHLAFYDAAAPIVTWESVDMSRAFWASRYDKGDADYLNCPMTRDEYARFYEALISAQTAEIKDLERGGGLAVFEGCMPIEVMAGRGEQTLLFGPLKPVGLQDPACGQRPYAVVQLRKENLAGTLLNLVGFQTRLKWGEQQRVFRLIPALRQAEFVRFGVMHRNTFINAPKLLRADYSLKKRPELFFAGQISGVEGYVESAASGLTAGLNAWRRINGRETLVFPAETALGGLARHVAGSPSQDFQPMNINFGLLPPWPERIRGKREKNAKIAQRALSALDGFMVEQGIG